jgi:TolB protein
MVWSPNGAQIAFATDRDGNLEVYRMNADGTGVTNLSNNGAIDGGVIDWSPDGTTITWTGTHVPGNPEIFAVPAGGGTPVNLTNSAGVDNASLWSPDGSRIIFVSSRDLNFEVYVMKANGSGQARVTFNAGQDLRPVWRQ